METEQEGIVDDKSSIAHRNDVSEKTDVSRDEDKQNADNHVTEDKSCKMEESCESSQLGVDVGRCNGDGHDARSNCVKDTSPVSVQLMTLEHVSQTNAGTTKDELNGHPDNDDQTSKISESGESRESQVCGFQALNGSGDTSGSKMKEAEMHSSDLDRLPSESNNSHGDNDVSENSLIDKGSLETIECSETKNDTVCSINDTEKSCDLKEDASNDASPKNTTRSSESALDDSSKCNDHGDEAVATKTEQDKDSKKADEGNEPVVIKKEVSKSPSSETQEKEIKVKETERVSSSPDVIVVDKDPEERNGNRNSSPAVRASSITPTHDTTKTQSKGKSKPAPDNIRPVGRMLYELGLDLVRQEVYKDLIDIQAAKDDDHRLDDKEKGQLVKLTEAHAKLRSKNASYLLQRTRCMRCKYSTTSRNVLLLHQEHGHLSHTGVHNCCVCGAFQTRFPAQFVTHMETVHRVNGKIAKKLSPAMCSFCVYEHKNVPKVEAHAMKCGKKFQLASNLQPLPSDCDIPIKFKPTVWMRPQMNPSGQVDVSTSAVHRMQSPGNDSMRNQMRPVMNVQGNVSSKMEIGGQMYSWGNHLGKPILAAVRSQGGVVPVNGPSHMSGSSNAMARPNVMNIAPRDGNRGPAGASNSQVRTNRDTCEICGMIVESRQLLWSHLQIAHKVELSRSNNVQQQEPSITCEICKSKFWTYQGLARHSLLLHKKNISGGQNVGGGGGGSGAAASSSGAHSFRCHICGASQTANPLNHLSTHHNITLLDMYHSRQCCMCNRKLRTGRAFEEHMVQEHRDIFANHDVLRTVLQALSTALYLKSEDVQHGSRMTQSSAQARMPNFNPTSFATISSMRQRLPQPQNSAYMDGLLRQRSALMMNHQGSGGINRKPKPVGTSRPVAPAVPVTQVKTPDKKTLEEEAKVLNKLYEDYADIGRPISRSMKHKLLLSPGASSANKKIDSAMPSATDLDRASTSGGSSGTTDKQTEGRTVSSTAAGQQQTEAVSSSGRGNVSSNVVTVCDDVGEPQLKKPRLANSAGEEVNDTNRSASELTDTKASS